MNSFHQTAKEVLELGAHSLKLASDRLSNQDCEKIIDLFERLRERNGSLIFCGVGKSGILAESLSATFASLGLKSYFLHPIEALHGDLGRVDENDLVVLLSKSGGTEEILKMIPFLPVAPQQIIGLIGDKNSAIAAKCDFVLDCSVPREACVNNQAPTTSSTLTLTMGHVMAVLFQKLVGLSKEGFATNHPGGMLGKSLMMKVSSLMIPKEECPKLGTDKTLYDAIFEMSKSPLGALAIMDGENFLGMVVEGDIRRTFVSNGEVAIKTPLVDIMNKTPISVSPSDSALKAIKIMEKRERPLNILAVMDEGEFVGMIRLHDLLQEGFTTTSSTELPKEQ